MKTILSNWNLMRGLRLLLGLFAIAQAVMQQDWVVGFLGGFLLVTALANVGCCGAGGCAINHTSTKDKKEKVIYEELDYKK